MFAPEIGKLQSINCIFRLSPAFMECLGHMRAAAHALPFCDWKCQRRLLAADQWPLLWKRKRSIRLLPLLRAFGPTTEVKGVEEFADEEDYIKAGGSELFFVQMQERKPMEKQSKIADKLQMISSGVPMLDLIVIGCGPAGMSLAAEVAKRGLRVGLIGPDLPFTNNYGVWEDEFKGLGLEGCIEHVWQDTIVYLDSNDPILIGRAYGRVSRHLLHSELLRRCQETHVEFLDSKVEKIIEASDGSSIVVCEGDLMIPCRLATVASGAASGKLLQYEVGGPRVTVQTAYGVEAEVGNNPYDPKSMVFMDYRDHMNGKIISSDEYPTFLYVMPLSSTRVFYEETCLASRNAMPFDLLRSKLMSRLDAMGVRILKIYEEEWSYIPVGGSLPNTQQKNLAFGAAASMVHPATGYSIVRSLSEAPKYASVISNILMRNSFSRQNNILGSVYNPSALAWRTLWPQERKRQRAFFLFGLALILQLDIDGIRTFFQTFFRLPDCYTNMASRMSGTDRRILCYCGLPSSLLTSRQEHSFGRQFYGCGKGVSARCGYFRWADGSTHYTSSSHASSHVNPVFSQADIANEDLRSQTLKLNILICLLVVVLLFVLLLVLLVLMRV